VLYNEGNLVVNSGTNVNIQGSYLNEGSGSISLAGVIQLTGDWTNNATHNIIASPGTTGEVIFDGSSTQTIGGSDSTFDFSKLTINNGAIVNVTAGYAVTAHGASTFNSPLVLETTTGFRPQTATFIDNGTVTGNITAQFSYFGTGSSTQAAGRTWYLASPISNATSTVFDVAAGNVTLAWYNISTSAYVKITTNGVSLTPMLGYELRTASSNIYYFTGPPNTGTFNSPGITGPSGQGGYYLIGNPYPSVLDWNLATKTNIYGTMWYRTMNLSNKMVYDTWNGSVGTDNNETAYVDGKVPPMQCFWVRVGPGVTGTVTFDNTMRTNNWGTAPFLKDGEVQNFDAFRIAVFSWNGSKDEQIIMHQEGAKDSMDNWDAFKMFVNDTSIAEIFTLSAEKKRLVIQAVAPDTVDKQFPLGIIIGERGNYKFVADLSGTQPAYSYFLEDKQMSVMQDLSQNPEYNFSSPVVSDSGKRFVIHVNYVSTKGAVSSNITSTNTKDIFIYLYNGKIFIKNCEPGSTIVVYDVMGRPVYNGKATSGNEIISSPFMSGIYIVKVIDKGRIVKSQKVPVKL
jgi:hypothetical protein